jgi:hypothetical protein
MRLTFLGQPYESTCNETAPVESDMTGKYRGTVVKFSGSREASPAHIRLTYRGNSYVR